MEILHLSYRETVHEIPYVNLLIMQKDKLHEVIGDKIVQKTARDNPKFKKMITK